MIPLSWFLILAAALFAVGLFGALSRKNAIAVLMSIELMLNAVNINLVGFSGATTSRMILPGRCFAVMVFAVAAAEVAVGLGLILAVVPPLERCGG